MRHIFLSASTITGSGSAVFMPNTTVSAILNGDVPTPITSLLSLNGIFRPPLSCEYQPIRFDESCGIVIHISVNGLSHGFVFIMSLHSIDLHKVFTCHGCPHHVAFLASHSSPLERSSTPSPHVPVPGDPGDHGGGPPGPLHERVFVAVHSWGVL